MQPLCCLPGFIANEFLYCSFESVALFSSVQQFDGSLMSWISFVSVVDKIVLNISAMLNGNMVYFLQLIIPLLLVISVLCLAFAEWQLGKRINASLSVRDLKFFKAVTNTYVQTGTKCGLQIQTFFP